jgi:hypothetical protein
MKILISLPSTPYVSFTAFLLSDRIRRKRGRWSVVKSRRVRIDLVCTIPVRYCDQWSALAKSQNGETHQSGHVRAVPLEIRQDDESIIRVLILEDDPFCLFKPSKDLVYPVWLAVAVSNYVKEDRIGGRRLSTHQPRRSAGMDSIYGTTMFSYISDVSDTITFFCSVYFLMWISVAGQVTAILRSGTESAVRARSP